MRRQRGRYADDDCVGLTETLDIDGGLEPSPRDESGHPLGRHVLDVAGAIVQLLDLGPIDIESEDGEPDLPEAEHERQADIAQTNNAHGEIPPRDTLFQKMDLRHNLTLLLDGIIEEMSA